jgi:RNA polymerase sigma factor (sigma-70 family)
VTLTLSQMAAPATIDGIALASDAESALATRFASGEAGAFEEVVAVYQDRVTQLASRLLGWNVEAEDVVQDVFLAALAGAKSFRASSLLLTWLTTITLNRCRRHARRQALWRRFWSKSQRATREIAPASDRRPMDAETSRQVQSAVAALPIRDREVVVLFYLEQRPVAEIAGLLGASANAVQVRLHRARGRLERMLSSLVKD